MPTDQKVTGLSPVGVTKEREFKRLSFLCLRLPSAIAAFLVGSANGRRNPLTYPTGVERGTEGRDTGSRCRVKSTISRQSPVRRRFRHEESADKTRGRRTRG